MQPARNVHYIHRLSYSTQERLVGAFVITALILVVMLFIYSREAATLFADKFTVYGLISNAEGIDRDSQVVISGVEAGRVVDVDIASARDIRVEMELLERFHPLLRAGATASLDKPPMLGTPRIVIRAGDPEQPELPAGATLRIETPHGMDDMLADIGPAIREMRAILERLHEWTAAVSAEDLAGTMQELHTVARNAARVSEAVAQGQGVAGQLLAGPDAQGHLPPLALGLATTLDLAGQRLDELEPMLADAGSTAAVLPGLAADMQQLVVRLNRIAAALDGQVEQLPALVLNTRLLMERADSTLRAVQNTWPVSRSVAAEPAQTVIENRPLP